MSSVDAVRSLLSLDSVVKGVKEGDIQTDLAVDRWVRWLSVGLTLLLSTILIVKDFYSGDRVFCLPIEDLEKYTTSYAWAFAGNVNGYCGTNMTHVEKYRYEPENWTSIGDRKVIVEEEVRLFQHIFPLVLVVQAMVCSLPFFMWSLSAVGDIQANLKFTKMDLEKHYKENIEPFLNDKSNKEAAKSKRSDSTSLLELKTACVRWLSNRQNLTVKYFICLKFMTIFFGTAFILFYLICPYGMWSHVSKLEFTCNIQDKMIFKCMLSTGHFIPLVWITNMLSLTSNIVLGILHTLSLLIWYKKKPLLRKIMGGPSNFFESVAGLDPPEAEELKRRKLVYNDYEFMSDISYRNIHHMDCYYYMLATVLRSTIKRKESKSTGTDNGEAVVRNRGKKEHVDGTEIELESIESQNINTA